MRPKLKENPKEWLKFTLAMTVALAILSALLWRRKHLSEPAFFGVLTALGLVAVLCIVRPAWFRSFYRVGMTVSFYIGQVVGRVLLSIFFILRANTIWTGIAFVRQGPAEDEEKPSGNQLLATGKKIWPPRPAVLK